MFIRSRLCSYLDLILGRFSGNGNNKRGDEKKRKSENRVLKSTVGHFGNSVLDVKHLLQSPVPRDGGDLTNHSVFNQGKKKKKKGGGN
ncbi:hypothetical protein LguiB_011237 [Lonicera macranthoides]